MKIYFHRFYGYIALSSFIALGFGPFGGNPFNKSFNPKSGDDSLLLKKEFLSISKKKIRALEKMISLKETSSPKDPQTQKAIRAMKEDINKFKAYAKKEAQVLKEFHDHKEAVVREIESNKKDDIKEILQRPAVKLSRYIVAFILLFLGILSLRKVYGHKICPGISLYPRLGTVLGDSLIILFLSFGAYCVFAYGIKWAIGLRPYFYGPATGVVAIAYVPYAAFVAYFTSKLVGQSVEITKEGIRVFYFAKLEWTADWGKIQELYLKETSTITGGENFRVPRKMQTKLVIKTSQGTKELVEPPLKKTKRRIISEFQRYAPKRLKKEIEKIKVSW